MPLKPANMFTIENEWLKVDILSKGAELTGIYHKKHQQEYLWSADPAFWAKKSPVLFPIIGALKDDTYFYENRPYKLSRHGFARELEFSVIHQEKDKISFSIESDADTKQKFPFDFKFTINYSIDENRLKVEYVVTNTGSQKMYFSVGGHPAFKLPLTNDLDYSDYYLEFNHLETAGRWPISKKGLIEKESTPLLQNSNLLPLSKKLFEKDALVFKHLKSNVVSLKSDKSNHGLSFDFSGFPFLGIWAAPNADFVCIEPWCGIADSVDASQQLQEKEGIQETDAGEVWSRSWLLTLF